MKDASHISRMKGRSILYIPVPSRYEALQMQIILLKYLSRSGLRSEKRASGGSVIKGGSHEGACGFDEVLPALGVPDRKR